MGVAEIIERIKHLPPEERAEVVKFVLEDDMSRIPESFKEGMEDIDAGRTVDMETALNKPYPGNP